ncbi:hypothetical protein TrST_g5354 [Triparma strigata]|uniref:Oxidoreductase FAD/NAD(P)-binding domain-containing protein n=1 Tax=Triparma strigata TaxID=1606541 RepID=A0A9W7EJ27_9STRA|nr:hypothetical protein TrST_g5354 [Triparma strigata]
MDEFTKAGQYVQVQTPNTDPSDPKVSYLAMSCPPDSSSLNFMVKKSDSTSFLFEGGDVKELKVSQPLGNGFGIGENVDGYKFDFPVSHILLLCTGTGIAPIKSLLTSSELSLGKNGRTATMYWGLSNDKYCDKIIKELENDSLNVIPVFSNPMKNERQGYVQNALEEDGIKVPRNTAVFVVGQKGMAEAVKRICEEEGVYGERILSNF